MAVLERLQEEADLGMAKRLHCELNSARLATENDGVEGREGSVTREKGMVGDGGTDGRCKVGELEEWPVWRD
jgi:hypothetical protein